MDATQTIEFPSEEMAMVDGLPDEKAGVGAPSSSPVPLPPETLDEAGLSEELVAGLALKALYVQGATLGFDLVDLLALPMGLLDEVMRGLQERRFVEVQSTRGPSRGEYVFTLTSEGRKRAAEEMDVSRYVGPAPVPFEEFCRWVELQSVERPRVTAEDLRQALGEAPLSDDMLELLGPAVNSGRSLFLFGEPGNGKTFLAERVARVFGDRYFVPFAVLVDGCVMIVHDPVLHGPSDAGPAPDARGERFAEGDGELDGEPTFDVHDAIFRTVPRHDRRFAEARRPVVVTGGELTLEQLDLQWDATGRMYQAPPQLKAAGGVLVVDDLGRQRVPVRDLLNRWVVPLEQRRDYLTLRSGRKVVVPFDGFVIFSTNLEPRELDDEAFLRRIHYKVEVGDPDPEEYALIFRSCCEERGIEFEEDAVRWLFEEFYGAKGVEPRRCHPRDVLDHLRDMAEYRGEDPCLSTELLERACRSYFVS